MQKLTMGSGEETGIGPGEMCSSFDAWGEGECVYGRGVHLTTYIYLYLIAFFLFLLLAYNYFACCKLAGPGNETRIWL